MSIPTVVVVGLVLCLAAPTPSDAQESTSPVGDNTGCQDWVDEDRQTGGTVTTDDAPKEWVKRVTRNWMKCIPDEVKLHKISIPGTHDSAALFGLTSSDVSYARCQRWSLKEQLEAGIRYLDIRARRYHDGFTIHHGRQFQHRMFSDVMRTVNDFLSKHPSETVLMRVSEANGGSLEAAPSSLSFRKIWESQMQKYGVNIWDNGGRDEIPTLGQVRGKIVVLRDNRGNKTDDEKIPSNWGLDYVDDGPFMETQDKYKVSHKGWDPGWGSPISLESKKRTIRDYIVKAGRTDTDKLVLNHLSGGWVPTTTPLAVAKKTNRSTYDYIGNSVGQRTLGVLIMDFPGPRLIYRIVKSNLLPPRPHQ